MLAFILLWIVMIVCVLFSSIYFIKKELDKYYILPMGSKVCMFLLVLCTVGIIYSIIPMAKYIKETDETYEGLNLIEYFKQWDDKQKEGIWHNGPRIPVSSAFAVGDAELRAKPRYDGSVIKRIPKEEMVNLIFNQRSNEWFLAGYKGDKGWIHGKYLRPIKISEKGIYFSSAFKLVLSYTFPEQSIIGKIFGFLIGIIISAVIYWRFADSEMINTIKFSIVIFYFLLKNSFYIFASCSLETIVLSAWGIAISAVSVNIIVSRAFKYFAQ